jgi:APA family basic amino acid/polyamine antiporter
MDTDNFVPFNVSGESDFAAITITTTLTFFAFVGMESATVPSGNIDQPQKTIPRATRIGTGITMLVYILGSATVMGMIPAAQLVNSHAPFADAAVIMWGETGRYCVAAGAIVSTFGALNGWILFQGQIPMAAARDKIFPRIFMRPNKRGLPAVGLVISSVVMSALLMMNFTEGLTNTFTFMVLLSTMIVLVPYLFSAASYSIIVLGDESHRDKIGSKIVIAAVAFFYSLWAVAGSGEQAVYWGFIGLTAGIPLFVWMKRRG